MKRREAREQIFMFLYQVQIQTDDILPQREYFLTKCTEELGFAEDDLHFITKIIDGVYLKSAEIDAKIAQYLKKWTVERLPKIDLAILRLAVFEIMSTNTDFSVIVNEAVLLAKKYSTEEARAYINGVLAQFAPDKV